jgi:hypothetical protein
MKTAWPSRVQTKQDPPREIETRLRASSPLLLGFAALLVGCQSAPQQQVFTAADYRNAQPMTAEQEARMLEIGERQNKMAPLHAAATIDPTGLSTMAAQASSQKDMQELQSMMPSMVATNRKRAHDYCATRPELPDCRELARLEEKARATGVLE